MTKKQFVWVPLCLFFLAVSLQAQINLLHSFSGGAADGAYPYGSLILKGSTLYGMTHLGGTSYEGTIFKINKDGSGLMLLHSFPGGLSDGANPFGSLILKGSTLYGMTHGGGSPRGTIFKINNGGTGFMLLHSFAGGAYDGGWPYGSLILKGSTLYGMTVYGGPSDLGTIFKINTNGTEFMLLHSFAGGPADGARPWHTSLILKGSTLYGMTGGVAYPGTIFKINTNGTGYAVLHFFAGGTSDGANPTGSLIAKGTWLYGMTPYGGISDYGTIFKINTNGTGYAMLYSFAGGASDGASPWGSLILKGSTLYGMTCYGGPSDLGTIFKMNTNGTGYALLHSFAGYPSDGNQPYGSLILKGSTLYGMTTAGGTLDDGVIFSFKLK